jgi:hypothetical protein
MSSTKRTPEHPRSYVSAATAAEAAAEAAEAAAEAVEAAAEAVEAAHMPVAEAAAEVEEAALVPAAEVVAEVEEAALVPVSAAAEVEEAAPMPAVAEAAAEAAPPMPAVAEDVATTTVAAEAAAAAAEAAEVASGFGGAAVAAVAVEAIGAGCQLTVGPGVIDIDWCCRAPGKREGRSLPMCSSTAPTEADAPLRLLLFILFVCRLSMRPYLHAPLVPARLDALGIAYTGCSTSALFETLSKVGTKLSSPMLVCQPPNGLRMGRGLIATPA